MYHEPRDRRHALARAGLATLRRGGNTVDAAIVIRIEPDGFTGGSDPRADGAALGV